MLKIRYHKQFKKDSGWGPEQITELEKEILTRVNHFIESKSSEQL